MKIRFAGIVFAVGALACQQDRQNSAVVESEARDSAGIRIVENARPPEGSRLGWTIGPEPLMSIGVLEGEEPYMLHWAFNSVRLSDGRIVVVNAGTQELRMFDESGTHLLTWGGSGEGPGEFRSLTRVASWPGDSIIAWHSSGLALSVFDLRGNYGRSFTLQSGQDTIWLRPRAIAARRDGTILSILDPESADTAEVEIWNGDGVLLGSLGRHPSRPVIIEMNERGYRELKGIAYGRELVTGLWGDLILASPTTSYEIRAFRTDGTLARIVRREHVLRAPVEADLEPWIEEQVGMVASSPGLPEGLLDQMRQSLQSRTLAETFPAFSTILADAVGNLWVREYDFPPRRAACPVVDRFRSRWSRPGIRRDTRRTGSPRNRRGLHPGAGAGRTRGGVRSVVAAGAVRPMAVNADRFIQESNLCPRRPALL